MDQLDDRWIDILTGHAAKRFKYVDVREPAEFRRRRPKYQVVHIPLTDLQRLAAGLLEPSAEIVVYGSDDDDTSRAEATLRELGYENVLTFAGGFETLADVRLV
jgi:rhodanese-related sulfurtransferase